MDTSEIRISGDNCEVTEALNTAAQTKFGRLLKHYTKYITSIDILLKIEDAAEAGERQIAEATIHIRNKKIINVTAKSDDLYKSIEEAARKAEHPLEKEKDLHLGHQK